MAVFRCLLTVTGFLIAGVNASSFCPVGTQECFPHCCAGIEFCFKNGDGTQTCAKFCQGGQSICPVAHTCCLNSSGTYCCPAGHNCDKGFCSATKVETTPNPLDLFIPHIDQTLDDDLDQNKFDDDKTNFGNNNDDDSSEGSDSGFKWHYAAPAGGGTVIIVIPVCIVFRRRRLVRRRMRFHEGPASRSAVVSGNSNQSDGNSTARTSIPTNAAIVNTAPINLVGVQARPSEPPPYSEFVDDNDQNTLHDPKNEEKV